MVQLFFFLSITSFISLPHITSPNLSLSLLSPSYLSTRIKASIFLIPPSIYILYDNVQCYYVFPLPTRLPQAGHHGQRTDRLVVWTDGRDCSTKWSSLPSTSSKVSLSLSLLQLQHHITSPSLSLPSLLAYVSSYVLSPYFLALFLSLSPRASFCIHSLKSISYQHSGLCTCGFLILAYSSFVCYTTVRSNQNVVVNQYIL